MNPDQKFFAFIQAWARKRNCRFEIENFDGRESPDLIDGMAVDDVWGWLPRMERGKRGAEFDMGYMRKLELTAL